jgi:hypothetical protein
MSSFSSLSLLSSRRWLTRAVSAKWPVGSAPHARRLFERIIHLKLSTKKMKFFFKRYLEFESAHGTAEQVQHVRDAARAYVESIAA